MHKTDNLVFYNTFTCTNIYWGVDNRGGRGGSRRPNNLVSRRYTEMTGFSAFHGPMIFLPQMLNFFNFLYVTTCV